MHLIRIFDSADPDWPGVLRTRVRATYGAVGAVIFWRQCVSWGTILPNGGE